MARRPLAALLTALLLAFPGAAFAQSAGDDQYEDPFGSGGGGGQEQEQPAEPQATPAPTAEPTPESQTVVPEQASAAQATPVPAAPASQEQLPNTGLETGLVAAAGALLIGAGVALRARSSTR